MTDICKYFGFKRSPFGDDIPVKELLQLPAMIGIRERMDYLQQNGGIMVITGDVGAGKNTAVRWSAAHYHQSEVLTLNVVAQGGSITEFYKQLCWSLDLPTRTGSRAQLFKCFRDALIERISGKKQRVLLIIDESNLLRTDVLAEIHTLTQFQGVNSDRLLVVFCGQASFLDRITHHHVAPLASRVMAKAHLAPISRDQMGEYIEHHLKIAGVRKKLFSDAAIGAIHQGSAGTLRRANHLCRGSLLAVAGESRDEVTPEHVRIAATELI
jgi:type II secretory pathway predicted ATPase ExeA